MVRRHSLKIDLFCHIIPPKYKDALYRLSALKPTSRSRLESISTLYDLDRRFRIMDKFEGLLQVLSTTGPHPDALTDMQAATDLIKLANDEMAELVFAHPDRFAGAVACIPMSNVEVALRETERAINDLQFRGVQLFTPANKKPLDSPEWIPLYEMMARYDLPILIHPAAPPNHAEYKLETQSVHNTYSIFGWPYETTMAMIRLAFSGIFDRFPHLKLVTHHCGGMIPFFAQRMVGIYDLNEMRRKEDLKRRLTKAPLDYLKMFYNDTAIYGNSPALMCAHALFGSERMLFATDFPYDNQLGERYIRETINAIEEMSIPDLDKNKIFEDNARRLLRLPI